MHHHAIKHCMQPSIVRNNATWHCMLPCITCTNINAAIRECWKCMGTFQDIFFIPAFDVNPLTPTVIQKLLEIIGRVRLCPSCSFATALDSDINQTTGSGGHLSMWENRCMHAAVCLLRAGQPRSTGDAAKLGQFIGQFSWVTGDPIGVKGLMVRPWCQMKLK